MPDVVDPLFLAFQSAVAGRYSIDRELGRGGMGVVYLAREVDLDRPVAIKLLPPDRAADATLRARFLREARTAAKLSHPNIIPIHTVDEVGDFVFFAMAYIEGETLADRVHRRGPLPPSEAARLLREVAWALTHAHGHGVVHRDVKPDNILVEAGTGRALVADFGIAGAATSAAGASSAEIAGTPEFMSPEQALGKPVDARSDLYAFGATAYFALAGVLPFEGRSATEVLAKQVTETPRPLVEAAGAVPRSLAQLVERCLAKDPAARPPSAEAVGELLGRVLEQRRELPVALRAFVKHNARLSGGGSLLYPFLLLVGSAGVGAWLHSTYWGFTTLIAGLTVVPLGALANRARRLLKQGYGHADLAPAFKAEIELGREERAVDFGDRQSIVERILRVAGLIGGVMFAVGLGIGIATRWHVTELAGFLISIGGLAGTGFGIGSLILLQRRRDVDAEFYGRLWTGGLGRSLFRMARLFTTRALLPASVTHRPTELSIGMAAEQLFESLPKEVREGLGDVPALLRRLEQDAQLMRSRRDELQDVLGESGSATASRAAAAGDLADERSSALESLREERDLVHRRLENAVAALETIRLNLLRLHAGSGSVETFTTDLGAAFEVAKEIDRLLASRREVDDALREPSRSLP